METSRQHDQFFQDALLLALKRGGAGIDAGILEPLTAVQRRKLREYVSGIVRQQRWLTFLLDDFVRGGARSIEPTLRRILLAALYEMTILERPAYAAVDEAVRWTKRSVRSSAASLTNGVLRAVARRSALPHPDTGDPINDMAIRYSHPTWMVRRWIKRWGQEDTVHFLDHNNRRPEYSLRVNRLKIEQAAFQRMLSERDITWKPGLFIPEMIRVTRLQPLIEAGLLAEGLCAVQDEAAGLVGVVLNPQPGELVIDACAGRGGKALSAALKMNDHGRIVCIDSHRGRLRELKEGARRHGVTILDVVNGDLRHLAKHGQMETADRVLLDVPCTGFGVLGRRHDLRWNRTEEGLNGLLELQDELLAAAAHLVKPGGLLVYSTCTTEPEENQERVDTFLASHASFDTEAIEALPPSLRTESGAVFTLPHKDGVDGGFVARMRRIH